MDRKQRIKVGVAVAVAALIGGLLAALMHFEFEENGSLLGSVVFGAAVMVPTGWLVGRSFAKEWRRSSPDDVEVSWRLRAQSGAFIDLWGVLVVGCLLLAVRPSLGQHIEVWHAVGGAAVFGLVDLLVRIGIIQARAR